MIKCPNCGESYYTQHYSATTAVYYPPVYKDGINVNPDGNTTTTYCTCCKCRHNFHYEKQFGEIQSIIDDGEAALIPTVDAPLTVPTSSEPLTIEDVTVKSSSFENSITIPTSKDIERLEKKIDELAQKIDEILRGI